LDKYEYKVRADEIRALIQERKYKEAVEIADTIDWRNVKNSMMLCTISDLYKMCKRFEDSRDVLFLAYQRNPGGRMILYSLCELSIKLGDIVNAIEYLKEFKQVAPRDPGRLILKYKLYTAEEVSLEERIEVLEELQQYDCKEKWMYELAYLYHMQGVSEKCVEECNQIAIYFGEGKYVVKALELKALHEPLSAEQDALYRRLTGPKENDILVKDMDVSKFNTIDLQKELANSMAEVFFNDNEKPQAEPTVQEVSEPVEEVVEEVYDDITTMIPPIEEAPASEQETPEVEEAEADDITTVIPPITEPVKEDKEEPSDETVIYNINDLDSALKKEPGVARTVIPKQGRFDNMHEVMPKATNNPAIVFPNYDDMVSLEGDGQISFNIPDQEIVDKQITGQISIEDVLAEWERLRSANEKAWRENMHRKVLQQTSTLFKDFDESARNGLLEQLEEEVETSPTVELTTEEAARLGMEIEEVAEPDETADTEETPETAETTAVEESFFDDTEVTKVLPASEVIASLAAENVVPEEILTVSDVDTDSDSSSSDIREIVIDEEEPTTEELYFDRTPYVQEEDNTEEVSEAKEEEPVAEEPTEEQTFEDNGYLEAFAEASEERDAYDREFLQEEELAEEETTEPEVAEEPATEEVVEEVEEEPVEAELPKTDVKLYEFKALDAVEETVTEVEEAEEAVSEEIPVEEAESSEEEAEVAEAEPEQDTVEEEPEEVQEEPVQEPGTAEVEEPVTEEPAEEPEQEADTAESYETDAEPAEPEEPVIRPSGFTAEQEERFESFIQLEDGRKRLKEAIEKISTDSSHGNVIIGSEDLDSAIELAKGLIMELSSKEEISGKVAKIKASTLNAKDADETLSKLYGGALIIQDAHELRRETLDAVRRILSADDKKLFIVLTCLRRSKHKFISDNSDMLGNFDVSYDIEALNNKELAAYAKAYALSRDYTIDEMGMLALHTRIDSKQTNEHSVTVTEVRDLVDEAIARSTKKNAKYFLDVLMGKRYDENDMVVLKEKDFAEK
jgi:tetratricopeptide (TPR) repeat protein